MLKRDLSYDLFSRELQALDGLFSREPEDRVQWAKRGGSRPGTPTLDTGRITDADGKTIKTDYAPPPRAATTTVRTPRARG